MQDIRILDRLFEYGASDNVTLRVKTLDFFGSLAQCQKHIIRSEWNRIKHMIDLSVLSELDTVRTAGLKIFEQYVEIVKSADIDMADNGLDSEVITIINKKKKPGYIF